MSLSDKQIKAIALNAEMCAQDAQFQGLGIVLESAQEVLEQADSDERAIQDAKSAIEASDQEFSSPALEALRICIRHFEKINEFKPQKTIAVEGYFTKSEASIAFESAGKFLLSLWENIRRAVTYVWGKVREFFELLFGKKQRDLGEETLRLAAVRKEYDRFVASEKEFLDKTIGVELIQNEVHKAGINIPELQRKITELAGRVDPGLAEIKLKEVHRLFKEIEEAKQVIETRDLRFLNKNSGALDDQINNANDNLHGIYSVVDWLFDNQIKQRATRFAFQEKAMLRATDHGPAKYSDEELIEEFANEFNFSERFKKEVGDGVRKDLKGTGFGIEITAAEIGPDDVKTIQDLDRAQKYNLQITSSEETFDVNLRYASGQADFYKCAQEALDAAKEYKKAIERWKIDYEEQEVGLHDRAREAGLDKVAELINKFDGENPKDPFHAIFAARARVIVGLVRTGPNLMFAATSLIHKADLYQQELVWLVQQNARLYVLMAEAMRTLKEVDLMTKGALSK